MYKNPSSMDTKTPICKTLLTLDEEVLLQVLWLLCA